MYKIEFPTLNVVQYKLLIKHSDYLKAKSLDEEEYKKELKRLSNGKEWFTDASPYFAAITNGLFITCINREIPCIMTLVT